jgi:glucosylceramidase
MKFGRAIGALLAALTIASMPLLAQKKGDIQLWLTNTDKSALFAQQKPSLRFAQYADQRPSATTIDVDDRQTFQTIDGFGFALTGGSAQHLAHMDAAKRLGLLQELFAINGDSLGISYLRVSIGSSDLNDRVYSYDDLPAGETDLDLNRFDLTPDRIDLIPVLREILAINPKIQILASPWSAPPWMKTSHNAKGGQLRPEYYATYANYFVKYIQGMKAEGIQIAAITIQNEPLNEKNTPSMQMLAPDEAIFIKDHLGPAFQAAGIRTRIILYDHNCDVPEYPISILNDSQTSQYVDGSGFHLYGGDISAMTKVHHAYPKKNLYFTEFMAVEPTEPARISIAKPVIGTFIGALQNWSRNVLLWNLAANSKFEPHTDNGGCPICQGAVTIEANDVTRNLAYYAVAHFSKFVRPGSIRIASNSPSNLFTVAFRAPGDKTVLVVASAAKNAQGFTVRAHGKTFSSSLNPGSVATYVW